VYPPLYLQFAGLAINMLKIMAAFATLIITHFYTRMNLNSTTGLNPMS
jgi:hypothetical protein